MTATDSLALLGLGATNVSVFSHLVKQVKDMETRAARDGVTLPTKTVYLIDREGNHGGGKAWGIHAQPSMLFSHPAGGIPDGFSDWLRANEDSWKPAVEAHREGALKTWFDVNQTKLDNQEYRDVAMPRFVYGMFKKDQLRETLEDLPKSLDVRVIDGSVVGLDRNGSGKITLRFDDEMVAKPLLNDGKNGVAIAREGQRMGATELAADSVVIATGFSDPSAFDKVANHPSYFANTLNLHPTVRSGSFGEQLRNTILERYAQTGEPVQLGVLGTSATFKDITNMVDNDPQLRAAVHVTTVSSSGKLPDKISGLGTLEESGRALKHLEADQKLTYEKGRIADVMPAPDGGVHLVYEDGGTRNFDIAVQALGSAGAADMDIIKSGKASGVLTPDASSPSSVKIGPDFQAGEGVYIYGVLAEKEIQETIAPQLPDGLDSLGFLVNAHCQAPAMAGRVTQRLYGNDFTVSPDLVHPIDPQTILDKITAETQVIHLSKSAVTRLEKERETGSGTELQRGGKRTEPRELSPDRPWTERIKEE